MSEPLCGASFPQVTFVWHADGRATLSGMDDRKAVVWTKKGAVCPACGREALIRGDGKGFSRHVWQPADGQMKKASYDSAANRAARAFQERGRK